MSAYKSIYKPGLFKGKNIMVTGAGSGIGRATVHELSSLGARVILVGRNPEKLQTVQSEIKAINGDAPSYFSCDIRDEAAVRTTIEDALKVHSTIHGLVNNAGGQFPSPLADLSVNGWNAVIANNLTGGFIVSREVYNQCMKSHGGAIVNIVADMWNGMPGMGHSGAARAGMVNLTETAASEWAASGVRVNAVAPGWIQSSGFSTYAPEFQEKIKTLEGKVPLKRFGTESEISAGIVFLLSDAAAFITGTTLRIDGGVPNAKHTWTIPQHNQSVAYNGF